MCISSDNIRTIFNAVFCQRLVQNDGNICYNRTYPVLLNLGEHYRQPQNIDDIKLLALATYGWMPTILDNMGYKANLPYERWEQRVVTALSNVRDLGSLMRAGRVSILKKFTNNSYVGLSKFLHFIYPNNFAIWDSNVYLALKFVNADGDGNFLNNLNNELNDGEIGQDNYQTLQQYGELVETIRNCCSDDLARKTNTRTRFFQYETAILEANGEEHATLRDLEKSLFCLGQKLQKINKELPNE